MALQACNPSIGETEATGSGAQDHASLHNESPVGKHNVQMSLRQRRNWEHAQIVARGSPSFTSFSTCFVSVSSITSLHIAVCCFQENLHRKKNLLVRIIIISLEEKKSLSIQHFQRGKIPLAKTNKTEKNAKHTLLSGFRCLECVFKKSSANSKIRQMNLLLQILLSSDVSLDPEPKSCWVRL